MYNKEFQKRLKRFAGGVASTMKAIEVIEVDERKNDSNVCNVYYDFLNDDFSLETYKKDDNFTYSHEPRPENSTEFCSSEVYETNTKEAYEHILDDFECYFEDIIKNLSCNIDTVSMLNILTHVAEAEDLINYIEKNNCIGDISKEPELNEKVKDILIKYQTSLHSNDDDILRKQIIITNVLNELAN